MNTEITANDLMKVFTKREIRKILNSKTMHSLKPIVFKKIDKLNKITKQNNDYLYVANLIDLLRYKYRRELEKVSAR